MYNCSLDCLKFTELYDLKGMFQNDDVLSAGIHMHYKLKPALCIIFSLSAPPSPVPEIRWKKKDGKLPPNHAVRMEGAHLHLYNVQFEDGGTYQCEAMNSRGKDYHEARVSVEGKKYAVCHVSLLFLKLSQGIHTFIKCVSFAKSLP